MKLESKAFQNGGWIPKKYTCLGEDISPPLEWTDIPDGTRSFVLICDDPDAPGGTWVHWVICNIPSETNHLPEGIPSQRILDDGSIQGLNDFGKTGYGGPCPPPGRPHHYHFRLYALSEKTPIPITLTKDRLLSTIRKYIIESAELVGLFKR